MISQIALIEAWTETGKHFPVIVGSADDRVATSITETIMDLLSPSINIEDLTSTGGSAIRSVEAIHSENIEVLSCYSICSYKSKLAKERFSELQIKHSFLYGIDEILLTAFNNKYLSSTEIKLVEDWLRTGPFNSDI